VNAIAVNRLDDAAEHAPTLDEPKELGLSRAEREKRVPGKRGGHARSGLGAANQQDDGGSAPVIMAPARIVS
jgi:hypothetical protein